MMHVIVMYFKEQYMMNLPQDEKLIRLSVLFFFAIEPNCTCMTKLLYCISLL